MSQSTIKTILNTRVSLPIFEVLTWLFLLILAIALLVLGIHDMYSDLPITPFTRSIFREDKLLESLQALSYLFGSFACFLGLTRKRKDKMWVFWCLFFGCLLFLIFGEEISWGERLLGIRPPQAIADINYQKEMNFHNINGVYQNLKLVIGLFFVAFCYLLPVTNLLNQKCRQLFQRLQLPIFSPTSILAITIGLLFMTIPRVIVRTTGIMTIDDTFPLDEVGEFYVALSWLIYSGQFITGLRQNSASNLNYEKRSYEEYSDDEEQVTSYE